MVFYQLLDGFGSQNRFPDLARIIISQYNKGGPWRIPFGGSFCPKTKNKFNFFQFFIIFDTFLKSYKLGTATVRISMKFCVFSPSFIPNGGLQPYFVSCQSSTSPKGAPPQWTMFFMIFHTFLKSVEIGTTIVRIYKNSAVTEQSLINNGSVQPQHHPNITPASP